MFFCTIRNFWPLFFGADVCRWNIFLLFIDLGRENLKTVLLWSEEFMSLKYIFVVNRLRKREFQNCSFVVWGVHVTVLASVAIVEGRKYFSHPITKTKIPLFYGIYLWSSFNRSRLSYTAFYDNDKRFSTNLFYCSLRLVPAGTVPQFFPS